MNARHEEDVWRRFESVVRGKLVGCTELEIDRLQARRGRLPLAYARFLRLAGKSAGDFMRGSDFDYGSVANDLTESAREMMNQLGAPPLPPDALVFFGHQDYQFFWFVTGERADAAIFRFIDGDAEAARVASSFSEWLDGALTQYEAESVKVSERRK